MNNKEMMYLKYLTLVCVVEWVCSVCLFPSYSGYFYQFRVVFYLFLIPKSLKLTLSLFSPVAGPVSSVRVKICRKYLMEMINNMCFSGWSVV